MNKIYLVLKIIIFILCIGSIIFSWNNWSKNNYETEFQEKIPLNWNKNLITSIQIIKNDEDCLEYYQLVQFAQLFDQKSSDIYFQKYQKDTIQSDEVAQTLQEKVNNELSYFAFNNKSQNEQQIWKMCIKSMNDISFSSKKNQFLELCEINEKICPVENNKIICVSNQLLCPFNSNNFCPLDKKQCTVNSKIQCVDQEESCPKADKNKQCLSSQKLCIVQDRVLCQNANEQCPIVDILILEKSSQIPENYEEEIINFDSNYRLLVKRNDPSKWPVAEIAIFRVDNQCLTKSNQIQNLFTIKNDSIQPNECMDGIDKRYQEIFQESLSAKQLFLSNKIIKDTEEINPEFNQSFKIYQRQYYYFDTTCSYSNDFENFNTKYRGIIGLYDLIIKSLILMFLLINIIMNKIINKIEDNYIKGQTQFLIDSSYIMSIIVSIINGILLYSLDFKQIQFLDEFTSNLIEDECVNQYSKVYILNIQKSLNMHKSFWRILFIISIIAIVIFILNLRFEFQLSNKNRNENNMQPLSTISIVFLSCCFLCEGLLLIGNSCCLWIEKYKIYQVGQNKTRCSCQGFSNAFERIIFENCDRCVTDECCKYCCSNCKQICKQWCQGCSYYIKTCTQSCTNCVGDCCNQCTNCADNCCKACGYEDCFKEFGCKSCYECNIRQGIGEFFSSVCKCIFSMFKDC